jgi:endonuclease/exonuclease/phosphatase family metal-dependent hydrolase
VLPSWSILPLCLSLLATGCGGPDSAAEPNRSDGARPIDIPARGAANTLDLGTWNLDWFGDTGNGPTDEEGQRRNIRDVIRGSGLDLWSLQEVVDDGAFRALVAELPGYAGLLADEPAVGGGATWYQDFGDREQKVALLYRTEVIEIKSARVILTADNFAFAGRPPVEIEIRATVDGRTIDGVVILLHAKASPDDASWARRETGAKALRRHLDERWPTMPVWVLGDFNDDVDRSIAGGKPSPYAAFVEAVDWAFPTESLSHQGTSSTVHFSDVIDHHLVSDEALGGYVTGSAEAFRVDRWIPSYDATTTDHYPVVARYRLPGG